MYLAAILDGKPILVGPFEFECSLNSAYLDLQILNFGCKVKRCSDIRVLHQRPGFLSEDPTRDCKPISPDRFYQEIVLGNQPRH